MCGQEEVSYRIPSQLTSLTRDYYWVYTISVKVKVRAHACKSDRALEPNVKVLARIRLLLYEQENPQVFFFFIPSTILPRTFAELGIHYQ